MTSVAPNRKAATSGRAHPADTLLLTSLFDPAAVGRVFGEPCRSHGCTVIPVARVQGGGGGGWADEPTKDSRGGGAGFSARPVGVVVIDDQGVRWQPTRDDERVAVGAQVVAVVALLTIRTLVRQLVKLQRQRSS